MGGAEVAAEGQVGLGAEDDVAHELREGDVLPAGQLGDGGVGAHGGDHRPAHGPPELLVRDPELADVGRQQARVGLSGPGKRREGGGGGARHESIQFNSIQFNSIQFKFKFNSIQIPIQFNSIQFNSKSYLLGVEHDKFTEKFFSHGPQKKREKKREIIK